MTLQAHVTNLGLHFGLEKHATLADAYCQIFRLDALGGSRDFTTPQEFAAFTASEMASWGKIIRAANIKIE